MKKLLLILLGIVFFTGISFGGYYAADILLSSDKQEAKQEKKQLDKEKPPEITQEKQQTKEPTQKSQDNKESIPIANKQAQELIEASGFCYTVIPATKDKPAVRASIKELVGN